MTDQTDKTGGLPALDKLRGEFVRVAHAESRAPSSRRLLRAGLALASFMVLAAGTTIGGFILTSDDDGVTGPQPELGGMAPSGPLYESLPELVAKTDLIVVGTVQEVLPPEVIEGEDPDYPTREFNTVVRVDEALKGTAPAGVVTVKTLELAFGGPGSEEWREPGKRVLLFLSPSRETAGVHIPANTNYYQTAFVIQGEDLQATLGDDPLSDQIAALTLAELRQALRAPE